MSIPIRLAADIGPGTVSYQMVSKTRGDDSPKSPRGCPAECGTSGYGTDRPDAVSLMELRTSAIPGCDGRASGPKGRWNYPPFGADEFRYRSSPSPASGRNSDHQQSGCGFSPGPARAGRDEQTVPGAWG